MISDHWLNSNERSASVAGEYYKLLDAEAIANAGYEALIATRFSRTDEAEADRMRWMLDLQHGVKERRLIQAYVRQRTE